ncbi:MAG: sulfatase [Planctomycetes bacterium]|nr:sulfatase [Planctomycetota bacterium]
MKALAAGTAGIAAGIRARSEEAPRRKPNIVVIVSDDQGYADVGVHGCRDIPTPNLDALARAGVRCTDGHVSCPVCSPTRAGLMTGRYQQRFGHEFNPRPGMSMMPAGEITMAQLLRRAGYATGMVGKWHLGMLDDQHPMSRGFDSFFGFLGGAHSYLDWKRGDPILRGVEPVSEPTYLTDAFAREAIAFIDRSKEKPFFLCLTFNAVHMPLEATQKYLDRFPKIAEKKRRTYAAMLSAMDDAIGGVLAAIARAGVEEDTLVFFFSDNGGPPVNGSSNGPLRGHKGETWEGGIRVPFFIKWPRRIRPGTVYDRPVISLDVLPTAVAAAGGALPKDRPIDGVDLLPYLAGEKTGDPHERLFWRLGSGKSAVRMGSWKLVRATGGAGGLFDLSKDLGEKDDLSAKEPAKRKDLEAAFAAWQKEVGPAPERAVRPAVQKKEAARKKAAAARKKGT